MHALSWVLTIAGMVMLALSFVDEVWLFAAWPVVLLAVWADNVAIEQK